jgi:hypothetical protein
MRWMIHRLVYTLRVQYSVCSSSPFLPHIIIANPNALFNKPISHNTPEEKEVASSHSLDQSSKLPRVQNHIS